jgi:hypothetical protein
MDVVTAGPDHGRWSSSVSDTARQLIACGLRDLQKASEGSWVDGFGARHSHPLERPEFDLLRYSGVIARQIPNARAPGLRPGEARRGERLASASGWASSFGRRARKSSQATAPDVGPTVAALVPLGNCRSNCRSPPSPEADARGGPTDKQGRPAPCRDEAASFCIRTDGNLAPFARALLTATDAIPGARTDGTGGTGLVRSWERRREVDAARPDRGRRGARRVR